MSRMWNRRPILSASSPGFSLLEILVALSILGIGLVTVMVAAVKILDLQKSSRERQVAGVVLQEKCEQVFVTGYNGQPMTGVTPDSVYYWTVIGREYPVGTSQSSNFRNGQFSVRLYEVVIRVKWGDLKKNQALESIQIVRGRPGPNGLP